MVFRADILRPEIVLGESRQGDEAVVVLDKYVEERRSL
jgi:hypothetical protein